MEILNVERIDHHGIVAGVIKDLGFVEAIDDFLGIYPDEKISCGEAVAGMILNGLGFTDRPMTLTPQFFENCPLELLFRPGIVAEDFNRFKLGRTLERVFEFGCDALFANLAQMACRKEGIDTRFGHLDTTSFSVTGKYLEDTDENVIKITHGYSKDHRPDLKQIIQELIVSQDSGVPFLSKSWGGNTSDNEIFTERTKALVSAFKNADSPKFLIADSKLYSKENCENLKQLIYITRIPDTISEVKNFVHKALEEKISWITHSEKRKYKEFELEHNGIEQRWIVVFSTSAENRIKETVRRAVEKEYESIKKELLHLQAKRFSCESDAKLDLKEKSKKWKFHLLDHVQFEEHKKFSKKGRPKPNEEPDQILYQITCSTIKNEEKIAAQIEKGSCYVVGTNAKAEILSAQEIIDNYSEQQKVERGFRFLKDPLFFTSSLFIKKASRIEAMLMVMTLALVVYSIAERRVRNFLKQNVETIPNQIHKPVQNPTLRWVFQLLEGISRVVVKINNQIHTTWKGLTDIRLKILKFFGATVQDIYQIS
jgi:transposase